jgi:hypothetical protein
MNLNGNHYRLEPVDNKLGFYERDELYSLQDRVDRLEYLMADDPMIFDEYIIGYFENRKLKRKLTLIEAKRLLKLSKI